MCLCHIHEHARLDILHCSSEHYRPSSIITELLTLQNTAERVGDCTTLRSLVEAFLGWTHRSIRCLNVAYATTGGPVCEVCASVNNVSAVVRERGNIRRNSGGHIFSQCYNWCTYIQGDESLWADADPVACVCLECKDANLLAWDTTQQRGLLSYVSVCCCCAVPLACFSLSTCTYN